MAEVKDKEKDEFDVFNKLLKTRTLFLMGEIDNETASDIIAKLIYLDNSSHTKEIVLYINSPGGIVESFFAIYDMVQYIAAPVKTICVGEACSAAAVLLAGGSKGKRWAMPNSLMMIHSIQFSDVSGSMPEMTNHMKAWSKLNRKFVETLACHTGQTLAKVTKDCERDHYFSVEEALEYGLIDKIVKPKKKVPALKTK